MPENDYFESTRGPEPHQRIRPEPLKAEFQDVERGFSLLPNKDTLAGSAHLLAEETAASAANVYVLESEYPFSILIKGATVRFYVQNTNTGACTVNVDGTGVKNLKNINGSALTSADLVSGWLAEIAYNGIEWRLQNSANAVVVKFVLTHALSPKNYQRGIAITAVVLPAATGGASPYTYAVTGLPTGLAFVAATRTLSGTPSAEGQNLVTYTVTDANSNSATFQFAINIVAQLLMLPDPMDRTLTAGTNYSFTLAAATGGTSPYVHSIENMPPGMAFDVETRILSGTPSTPGVYTVTLSVSDAGTPTQTVSQTFTLTVRSSGVLAIVDLTDREFVPNSGITAFTLPAATGGVPSYTYILTGLGEGLSFNNVTRQVSGTPTVTGDRVCTYRAEDAQGTQVEKQFTISIQSAGRRYIAVNDDQTPNATDISAGNDYSQTAQELTLPTWTGDKYIVIAQPSANDDLTLIALGGLGNAISAFDKLSSTVTISGVTYEVWVGKAVQGGAVLSGAVIEVRP